MKSITWDKNRYYRWAIGTTICVKKVAGYETFGDAARAVRNNEFDIAFRGMFKLQASIRDHRMWSYKNFKNIMNAMYGAEAMHCVSKLPGINKKNFKLRRGK